MRRELGARVLGLTAAAVSMLAPGGASAAPPALGPMVEVDRPVLAGAPGDQTLPAAAHVGGDLLVVVWRTSLWEGEVRAARVTASGQVRDPRGVVLPGLAGAESRLAVAAGGGQVLVVAATDGKLQAMPLGAATAEQPLLPGPPALLVAAPPQDLGRPAVAWNGASFWVVWSQGPAGVLAARVSGEGQPLDPAPLLLSTTPGQVALVHAGANTLAVWSTVIDGRVVLQGTRLDPGGTALDAQPRALGQLGGSRAGAVAVAVGQGRLLVAAAGEGGEAGAATIEAIRLGMDGLPVDPAPAVLARLLTSPEGGPTAIWNGDRFVVLWGERDRSAERVIFPDGRLVAADGLVSALGLPGLGAAGEQPVAVAAEGRGLVFLARAAGGRRDLDIRGVRLGAEGQAAGGDFLVSGGLNWQGNPALAAGSSVGRTRVLMAWEDARQDRVGGDIHAALFDGSGAPVGSALALAVGTPAQQAPAVAWDGRGFQVVWRERGRGLLAARVGPDGALIDRPALVIPGTAGREALSDPVMCGDDAGAVLIWSARRDQVGNNPLQAELRIVRVGQGGNLKQTPSAALLTTRDVSTPPGMRLGCAADAALLVWGGLYEVDSSNLPDLQMAAIPRRGEIGPLAVTLLERGTADEGPAVASDGAQFLVAWRPRQNNGARVAIVGTRVDVAGMGRDMPARELGSLNAGHRITVHWDGEQWLLAGIQSLGIDDFQLRGRSLTSDLSGMDPDWFAIDKVSSRRGTGTLPVTAGLGQGTAVVAYEAFADDDATGNQRLRLRVLGPARPDRAVAGGSADDGASSGDGGAAVVPPSLGARGRGGGCDCATAGAPRSPPALAWLAVAWLVSRWRRPRPSR